MRSGFLLAVICLLGADVVWANDCDNAAVDYLKVIERMDWDEMADRLASDARYQDPTMTFFDRDAIDLSGPDAIVGFWREASAESGTESIAYDYQRCFETAGYHVVHYGIDIRVAGHYWDVNLQEITIPGQVTSIIQIVDGRVALHVDYVDYAGGIEFVDALRAQHGSAPDQALRSAPSALAPCRRRPPLGRALTMAQAKAASGTGRTNYPPQPAYQRRRPPQK